MRVSLPFVALYVATGGAPKSAPHIRATSYAAPALDEALLGTEVARSNALRGRDDMVCGSAVVGRAQAAPPLRPNPRGAAPRPAASRERERKRRGATSAGRGGAANARPLGGRLCERGQERRREARGARREARD